MFASRKNYHTKTVLFSTWSPLLRTNQRLASKITHVQIKLNQNMEKVTSQTLFKTIEQLVNNQWSLNLSIITKEIYSLIERPGKETVNDTLIKPLSPQSEYVHTQGYMHPLRNKIKHFTPKEIGCTKIVKSRHKTNKNTNNKNNSREGIGESEYRVATIYYLKCVVFNNSKKTKTKTCDIFFLKRKKNRNVWLIHTFKKAGN